MINIKFVLPLVILSAGFASVGAAASVEILRCDGLLKTSAARKHQEWVAAIFADDDFGTETPVYYAGVAPGDLLDLMNYGKIVPGPSRILPLRVRTGDDGHPPAPDRAARQALARTRLEIMRQRFPDAPLDEKRVLEYFSLMPGPVAKPTGTWSPTFRQINDVIEASAMPKLKDGSFPKLKAFAKRLGLKWENAHETNSPIRAQVVEAFANLPQTGGVVLALKKSAIEQISAENRAHQYIYQIRLDDVIGIDALSDYEYQFLEQTAQLLLRQ